MASPERGRFLVLDGVDGCGKSTQAARLAAALEASGRPRPLHLREPGSTAVGEHLRALLLERREAPLATATEALLFCAARRQLLEELVEPGLAAGRDVVCERFHPSTFAYQGVAGELGEEPVLELLLSWANEPAPDLVLLLELEVEEAARRAADRAGTDRFEARGLDYQREVARGYRRYAERAPGPVARVEAAGAEEDVAERVWKEVRRVLG